MKPHVVAVLSAAVVVLAAHVSSASAATGGIDAPPTATTSATAPVLPTPEPSSSGRAPAPVPDGTADQIAAVLSAARAQIGRPYAWGATGPDAFDCSGLVTFAFAQAGVQLPRTSFVQATVGQPVRRADIRAGDLVFFRSGGPGASHVGILTSNASMVSALNGGVAETSFRTRYWSVRYVTARRL